MSTTSWLQSIWSRSRTRRTARRAGGKLWTKSIALETLEARVVPSTIVVNNVNDGTNPPGGGVVSIRDAIAVADSSSTPTTITFDPTVFANAQTIVLTGGQLELSNTSEATTINGPSAGVTISGNNATRVLQVDQNVTATISLVTIAAGNANGSGGTPWGGGILNFGALTLTNDTISNNSASYVGGGIYNAEVSGADLTLTDDTIANNTSASSGGGLFNDQTAVLTNVTVSGNSAQAGGGILSNSHPEITTTLGDVTIANNSAPTGGGIYNAGNQGQFSLANTIVAGDVVAGSSSPDAAGAFNSLGNNLVGETDGSSGWISADITGTSAAPVDADLDPLANEGGPTETQIPLSGSPAIAAGSVALIPAGVVTDQRGSPRTTNGAVDIGSVEGVGSALTTSTTVAPSTNPVTYGQPVTFTATVTNPAGATPTGTVEFFDGSTDLGAGISQGGSGNSVTWTFTTATLSTGNHTITADFHDPSGFFLDSDNSGALFNLVVSRAATTTSVTSSENPAGAGDNLTFTAQVYSPGFGQGLTASYYNYDIGLGSVEDAFSVPSGTPTANATLVATRIDPQVYVPNQGGFYPPNPVPGLNASQVGAEWSGYVQILQGGSYTFYSTSDDGSLLYIDGNLAVNNDGDHGFSDGSSTPLSLSPGLHTFLELFEQNGGGAGVEVGYFGPDTGGGRELVPASAFYTGNAGGPTGTVQFEIDGQDYGSPVSVNPLSLNATISDAALAVGTHTVTAFYSGDSNFLPSDNTGAPLSQQVLFQTNSVSAVLSTSLPTSVSAAGSALSFNGGNDYAITPNLASAFPTTSVTVEMWFKADAAGVLLDELGQPGINQGWNDSQIEVLPSGEVLGRVWGVGAVDLGNAAFGAWHYVVLRYNSSSGAEDGFLDGVESGVVYGGRSTPWQNGDGLYYALGATEGQNLGSGAWFDGNMDDVSIWNVALPTPQIESYSQPPSSSAPGLVADWQLDDGAGMTAVDATGNYPLSLGGGNPVYAPTWATSSAPVYGQVSTGAGSTQAGIAQFSVVFTQPLDAASASSAANFSLFGAGINYALTPSYTAGSNTVYFSVAPYPLQPGTYSFDTLSGLTDQNGGEVTPFTLNFTISNPIAGQIANTTHSSIPGATALPMTEAPTGSGFYTALGVGTLNNTNTGTYSDPSFWYFNATTGDQVTVRLEAPGYNIYPNIYLEDAAGNVITSVNGGYYGYAELDDFTITKPGTYYVAINSYNNAAYQMRVDLSQTPLGPQLDPIPGGTTTLALASPTRGSLVATVAGALPLGSGGDTYDLGTLNAGNAISANINSPSFSTLYTSSGSPPAVLLSLYQAGNNTAVATSTAGSLNYSIPSGADGDYRIVVQATLPDDQTIRAQYLLQLSIVDGVSPTVISTSLPAQGGTTTAIVNAFTVNFSTDLAPATLLDTANYVLEDSHGNTYSLVPAAYTTGLAESYTVSDGPLQVGSYTLTLSGITDRAQNPLATYELNFSVQGVAPYVLEGRSDTGFATATPLAPPVDQPDGTFTPTDNFGTGGNSVYDIATGIFTSSGHLDLVTPNFSSGTISVFLGNGNGTFQAPVTYAVGNAPDFVTVGDFTGNGILDLAVANDGDGTVSILMGNGNGTFQPQVTYAVGQNPQEIVAADLTGHGPADLVVPNYGSSTISVLLNNGDGTFAPAVTYATDSGPVGLAATDLTGSGVLDLVTANQNANTIDVFMGNADGTFAAPVSYASGGSTTRGIAAGDFGNGLNDIAVSNYGSSTISVFLNQGGGVFGTPTTYSSGGSTPYELVAADLNNNGITDLAVANYNGSNVGILYGNGDGTFSPVVTYGLQNPTAITAGNFDGNGLLDLATASYNYSAVTILTNNPVKALTEDPVGSGLESSFARGALTPSDGSEFYSFTATAGDLVTVASDTPGEPYNSGLFYALYDSVGNRLDYFYSTYYGGYGQMGPIALPTTGTYYVGVYYNYNYQGEYDLRVSLAAPAKLQVESNYNNSTSSANGVDLTLTSPGHIDATVAGAMSSNDRGDYYQLGSLVAGTVITLKLPAQPSTSPLIPVLTVYDAAGNQVAVSNPGDSTLTFTVPGSDQGPYYAEISADPFETVSFWMNWDGTNNVMPISFNSQYDLYLSNGTFGFNTFSNGAYAISSAGLAGGWHFITALFDSGNFLGDQLWIDGVQQTLQLSGSLGNDSTTPYVGIGSYHDGGYGFSGELEDVAFFQRQLTGAEIQAEYNANTTASFQSTVLSQSPSAFYPLQESGGNIAYNALNNGLNGSIGSGITPGVPGVFGGSDLAYQFSNNGAVYASVPPSTAGLLSQYILDIDLANTTGPTVSAPSLPAEGGSTNAIVYQLTLNFSEDLTAATVNNLANYVLEDSSGNVYHLSGPGYTNGSTATYQIVDGPLQPGNYTLTVSGLADRLDNPLATPFVLHFSVQGIAPYTQEGRGDTGFATATPLAPPSSQPDGSFTPTATYNTGGSDPFTIAAGVFTASGHLDLVTADLANDDVSVFLGNGNGTFAAPVTYAVGSGPDGATVGDFNHDGNLDIAVANEYSGTVSILFGNGNGTFQPQVTYAVGSDAYHIIAADLNGPGSSDLVTANDGSNTVSVLLNNGDGTFAPAVNYNTDAGPTSVVAVDLTGNGILDLVTANYNAGTVDVFVGNGDGTFAATPISYATLGSDPYDVVAADFNGDHLVDIATANYGSSNVSVFMNQGDGVLGTPTLYGSGGSNPYHLIAADLENNGIADLAVANYNGSTLGILLGNGDGTFQQAASYSLNNPIAVVAGDFTGNGLLDLATASYYYNTITILTNNPVKALPVDPAGSGLGSGYARGALTPIDGSEFYSFTAQAGDLLTVATEEFANVAGPYGLDYTLYGVTGNYIDNFYSGYNSGVGQMGPITLGTTGTYYVEVSQWSGFQGEYDLRVTLAPSATVQMPSSIGNSINSANALNLTLTSPGHITATVAGAVTWDDFGDYYQLGSLITGTVVTLTLPAQPSTASSFVPVLDLYDAAGNVVASSLAGAPLTFTVPADDQGAYYFELSAAQTVSFWMNWDGTNSVMPVGFGTYDLYFNDGSFGFNTGQSDLYGISSAGLANSWHFVTATFGEGNATLNQLWIDGVQQTLSQQEGSTSTGRHISLAADVGSWTNDQNYDFSGELEDVAFFDRALSNAEIQAEFDATSQAGFDSTVLGQSPVAFYPLSETGGTTAYNLAAPQSTWIVALGNTNDGTIVGNLTPGVPGVFGGSDTAYQFNGPGSGYVAIQVPQADALLSQYLLDVDVANTTPPTITGTSLPAQGTSTTAIVYQFSLNFSEDLNPATVNDLGNYVLEDSNGNIYHLANPGYNTGSTATFQISDGPLQPGHYTLTVSGLTDRLDNPLTPTFVLDFTVDGIAPYVQEGRSDSSLATATPLAPLTEDPAGSGLRTGFARGALTPLDGSEFYSFTAQAGDLVTVADDVPGESLGSRLDYTLYDLAGNYIDNFLPTYYGGYGQMGPIELPTTGTYYMEVSYWDNYQGEYDLRVSLVPSATTQMPSTINNSPGNANPVTLTVASPGHLEATLAGAITSNDGGDYYQLGSLIAGTTIALSLPAQPSTSSLVPVLAIYDAAGNQVALSNPGDTSLAFTVPANDQGLYYAEIASADNSSGLLSQYLLDIDLANINAPTITSTSLPAEGGSTSGIVYQFTLSFSEDLNPATVNDVANYVLTDSNGNVYHLADPNYTGGTTVTYEIIDGPIQPGSLTLTVSGLTDLFGNTFATPYTLDFTVEAIPGLTLQGRSSDNSATPTVLTTTEDPAGTGLFMAGGRGALEYNGDVDYWTFTASAGDELSIDTQNLGSPGGTGLYYTVSNPDGSGLTTFYTDATGNGQDGPFTLTQTGTYTLTVRDNYSYQGEYRFRILDAQAPLQVEAESNDTIATATPLPLTVNGSSSEASVAGTILTSSDLDYFDLGVIQAGQSILLNTLLPSTSGLSPVVSVYNANGFYIPKTVGRPFDGVGQIDITTTGTYYALMQGDNGTGGVLDQYLMNVQVVPTSSLQELPNLEVTSITLPSGTNIESGQPITFSWTVTNIGQAATNVADWSDRAVMSLSGVYGASDNIPLQLNGNAGVYSHQGVLNPGQSYTVTETVNLPDGINGNYFIIVNTDSGDQVDESPVARGDAVTVSSGGPNGNGTFTVALAPYADLIVQDLVVNGPNPDGTFTVSWNSVNQGNAAVPAGWQESLVVKNMTTGVTVENVLFDWTGGLTADGGTQSHKVPLTGSYAVDNAGDFLVTVVTNSNQAIYEDNPNGHADAVDNDTSGIHFSADRDLEVSGLVVQSPANPQSGNQVAITWEDTNTGNLATVGNWTDSILVVNTTTGATLYNADVPYTGPSIQPGGESAQSAMFTLPDGAAGAGNISVTITVNTNGAEVEYNTAGTAQNNNTAILPFTSTLANYADLTVQAGSLAVQTPGNVQSGDAVTIGWNDQNIGDAAVNGAFTDAVLVQKVNADSSLTYIASGTVNGNASLATGATSAETFGFTLPNGTSGTGDIRVTVTVDNQQTILEFDNLGNPAYGNNTSAIDVTSTLAPYPDLVVANIVANNGSSNPVLPGETIPITWTDENVGALAVSGTWLDQVYLATNSAGTGNLQLLQTINGSGPLAANNGTLDQATTITVPATDVGNQWIVVTTGVAESFFELNTANNTTVAATPFTVPPSLRVSLAAPGNSIFKKNAVNPATTATVTRNDTNVGSLLVTITSSNPAAVLLAANAGDPGAPSIQVMIPNGSYSALFYVDAVQDGLVDGTQTSVLTPSGGSAYFDISDTATELETNQPSLALVLTSSTLTDTGTTLATLSRNTNPNSPNDTALTVNINSSNTTVATAPAQVTIPAGQNSVTFMITAVPTSLLVLSRPVLFTTNTPVDPVTGLNFAAAGAAATVTDTNIPTLELSTDAPAVEDNAAEPATYATLTLTDGSGHLLPATTNITVDLFSSDPTDLVLPTSITVPQGATTVRIPITAIDNPNNDNPVITITAYATESITQNLIYPGAASTTITVLGTAGPSLAISTTAPFMAVNGSLTATVSRSNADISQALSVNLASYNTSEATVPSSVVIPAGQASTTFTITGTNNTSGPGSVLVTFQASSAGLNAGVASLSVVNTPLPDLTITAINPPASPLSGQTNVPLSWTVENDGNVTASGSWLDHVVISTDPTGSNVLATQDVPFTGGSVAAGSSYTGTTTITVPSDVGIYYITVTTNSGANSIMEITANNDSLVVPLDVSPASTSTLVAGFDAAPAGSPIPLSGTADNMNGTPAAFAPVYVSVVRNSTPDGQLGPIFTDSNGHWSTTFMTPPGQSGHYQFTALTDGATTNINSSATAAVDLAGLGFNPGEISLTLVPGAPMGGTVDIANLSAIEVNNLEVTNVDEGSGSQQLPITVQVSLNGNSSLNGFTTGEVGYSLTATAPLAVTGQISVTISGTFDNGQTASAVLVFDVTISPPQALLNTTGITAGVVPGSDSLVSFTLTNSGSASTGPISIASPVSWITIASDPTPLNPGQSEQVQVQLAPPANQGLGEYTGNLAVSYGSVGLPVPFTLNVVSDQQSTLQVSVDDELTTFSESHPRVAGATVELIDPESGLPAATATTNSAGVATLSGFVAGTYELEVTADQHGTYTGAFTAQPGSNSTEVNIPLDTVTYTWTVVPTTVQDDYTIVLQADFLTNVPLPNLLPDKPFVMPLIGEGGSTTFYENITNEGLIAATDVQIIPINNPFFILTPQITMIPNLPAQSEITIPVTLTTIPGLTVQEYLDSGICPPLPQLDIAYTFVASNPIEQIRQVTVDPIFVTAAHYTAIESAWGAQTPSFGTLGQDLFNSPNRNFILDVLTTAGSDLWAQQQDLLSALANGLTGTAAQIAASANSLLTGLCPVTEGNEGSGFGGGFGGGGGGGGGLGNPTYFTPVTWSIPSTPETVGVRVEIDQQAVFTRDAFKGTLNIANNESDPITNVEVNLDIQTAPGMDTDSVDATNLFYVQAPQLSGLTAVDGTGVIQSDSIGSATYIIIPTAEAAPQVATQYTIGGTLEYTLADGTVVNVPLLPAEITVEPSPLLNINYFWQQQVEGPNGVETPNVVQPSVPFDLGVQVTNIGTGAANNFSITSAQPKIIENASGLLVGFNILGTTVNGQPAAPSLTANLGNILGGQTSTGVFILTSTLAGIFENFTASYTHDNALGGVQTSLINSLSIHDLVHTAEAGYVGNPATVPGTGQANPIMDDGIPDFLVSDLPGSEGQPDTLYLSQGYTQPVSTLDPSNVQIVQDPSNPDLYHITADMPAGWGYFNIPNPTNGGLSVTQVERADGLDLLVGDNVWQTSQNTSFSGIVSEVNDLHLLDFNATGGNVTYDVLFTNPNAVTPVITALQQVKPATRNTPVNTLNVTFNEPINIATFTTSALTLTINGNPTNLITATNGVNVAYLSGSTYQISGLAGLTAANGQYAFTVDAAVLSDNMGDIGQGTASTQWTMDTTDTLVQVEDVVPALVNTPVTAVNVVFSNTINAATFTTGALSLTLNGNPVDLTGTTIAPKPGTTSSYTITLPASVTSAAGSYILTVNPSNVMDANGNFVVGEDYTQWTMDPVDPAIISLQQPQSPRNIVVPTLNVTFSKPIAPSTFTLSSLSLTLNGGPNLLDSRTTIEPLTGYLIPANTYQISGISFPQSVPGTYTFTISNQYIADPAGNPLSASASVSWDIDLSAPAPASNLAISPDLGIAPDGYTHLTNTSNVTFSGSVSQLNTIVRLEDMTTGTYLGSAFVTGENWSRTLNLSAGEHELSAQVFDQAANGSTLSYLYVFVNLVAAAPATHLSISAPSIAVAGTSFNITVTALDAGNNLAPGYTGTIHFSSTDVLAGLPADYTFQPSDDGTHVFAVKLKTVQTSTITATDASDPSITGNARVSVSPAGASSFIVSTSTLDMAGVSYTVTVTAVDAYGNQVTNYAGTIHFSTSDGQAGPPGDYTFTSTDMGRHRFMLDLQFRTVGVQSVTVTDTSNHSIIGTEAGITVFPSKATQFVINNYPSSVVAGVSDSFTLIAEDPFGNIATSYQGTVVLHTSDRAMPPMTYTFTSADAGVHTFNVWFKTAGTQHLYALDGPDHVGGQAAVTVVSAGLSQLRIGASTLTTVAGAPLSVTVSAVDSFGNIVSTYTGTIHFTSSDPQAGLPADFTFTPADNGTHTFTNGVALDTVGRTDHQTITVTDVGSPGLTAQTANIYVTAAGVAQFDVGAATAQAAGTRFSVTVTAEDAYGNTVTNYVGQVEFTSSDPHAVLPANYTFTSTAKGSHTFNDGVMLETAGVQSITATDSTVRTLTGTQAGINVAPGAVKRFVVTGLPSSLTAGTAESITVRAIDYFGNTVTGYLGTVHFTSSDRNATLPDNYTFIAGDAGSHNFTATLKTAGSQALYVHDQSHSSVTGTDGPITVQPAAAASLLLTSSKSSTTAGGPFSVTVSVQDPFGNTVAGYRGTIHFTSTDRLAGLPADYTFTSTDAGKHVFFAAVAVKTAGTQSVTATDTINSTITGTVNVTVQPGKATQFSITGPPTASVRTPFTITVTALDGFGNVATGYTGTIHFSSSDHSANLPADYTFTSSDHGVASFTVTLNTSGNQSITATDTGSPNTKGSLTGIDVSALDTLFGTEESKDSLTDEGDAREAVAMFMLDDWAEAARDDEPGGRSGAAGVTARLFEQAEPLSGPAPHSGIDSMLMAACVLGYGLLAERDPRKSKQRTT